MAHSAAMSMVTHSDRLSMDGPKRFCFKSMHAGELVCEAVLGTWDVADEVYEGEQLGTYDLGTREVFIMLKLLFSVSRRKGLQ